MMEERRARSKLWLVALNEYKRNVGKRSFLFSLLSLPLIALVIAGVALLLDQPDAGPIAMGYVDGAGLLSTPLPSSHWTAEDVRLAPFQTEEEAAGALSRGEIGAYYVLPTDYPANSQVQLYAEGEVPDEAIAAFRDLLQVNLLADQPPDVAYRAAVGAERTIRLPDGREFSGEFNLGYLLPVLAGLAIIVLIFFGSGYLMQAITEEKANRTMEILATSVSPGRLIGGKILGIAAASLTQLVFWIICVVVFVVVGNGFLDMSWLQGLEINPMALLLVVLLMVPSYLFVASLMVAIGATLVEPRGSQQVMGVFISLYMLPMGFIGQLLNDLGSPLAVSFSLIPMTSPVFLPLRATLADVPAWQLVASVGLQYLCALGAMWLAGRAVRLGMLRYGRTLRWNELLGRGRRLVAAAPVRERPYQRASAGAEVAPSTGETQKRGKISLIMRQELIHVITRPWFALLILGLPLLVFGQMLAFNRSMEEERSGPDVSAQATAAVAMPGAIIRTFGYVDPGGLVGAIPPQVPADVMQPFPDESSARRALDSGEISSYFVIPADYVETGSLVEVQREFSPLSSSTSYSWMTWVLLANMLDGDVGLAARVWNPMDVQVATTALTPEAQSEIDEEAEDAERITSMLILLLFYAVIAMSAGFLLRSVSEEKKNRTIEILLLSASPQEILAGKTLALGLAGLVQMVGWGGLGYLLFTLGDMEFRLSAGLDFSPAFLAWVVVFFLCGYAVYAALFAGAGALVPNWREASGLTFALFLPALIGFEISLFQTDTPHSTLMVVTSLFPLTAPFTMIKRLLSGGVPLWQLLLSAVLMLATAYWITRTVARIFHAQNLLSGQPLSLPRYFRILLGRTG